MACIMKQTNNEIHKKKLINKMKWNGNAMFLCAKFWFTSKFKQLMANSANHSTHS